MNDGVHFKCLSNKRSYYIFIYFRPFWLSPRQAIVIPIAPPLDEYANEVRDKLHAAGYMADVDTDSGTTLNKKVRNAQLAQYNFILGKVY